MESSNTSQQQILIYEFVGMRLVQIETSTDALHRVLDLALKGEFKECKRISELLMSSRSSPAVIEQFEGFFLICDNQPFRHFLSIDDALAAVVAKPILDGSAMGHDENEEPSMLCC